MAKVYDPLLWQQVARLRPDQQLRIAEVGGDFSQLTEEELLDILAQEEDIGDFSAGMRSLGSAVETTLASGLDSLGFDETAQELITSAQQTQQEVARRSTPITPISDVYEDEGLIESLGYAPEYAWRNFLRSAPTMGAQVAGSILGRGVGRKAFKTDTAANIGGYAGFGAAGVPSFYGNNILRQMEERGIELSETDSQIALASAVGQTALDSLLFSQIGILGAGRAPQAIADAAEAGFTAYIAKKAGEGFVREATTESLQQAIEIIQANPAKFYEMDEETRKELLESAIAGGLIGAPISTVAAVPEKLSAQRKVNDDLARHLQDQMKQTAEYDQFASVTEQLGLPSPVLPEDRRIEFQPIRMRPDGTAELPGELGPGDRELEAVRPEGVGRAPITPTPRVPAVIPEPESALEGEYIPAVKEAVQILSLPGPAIEGTQGLPKGTGAIFETGPTLTPGEVETGRRTPKETVRDEEKVKTTDTSKIVPEKPDIRRKPLDPVDAFLDGLTKKDLVEMELEETPRLPSPDQATGIQVPPGGFKEPGPVESVRQGAITQPSLRGAKQRAKALLALNPFLDSRVVETIEKMASKATSQKEIRALRQRLRRILNSLGVSPERTTQIADASPQGLQKARQFSRLAANQDAAETRQEAQGFGSARPILKDLARLERIRKRMAKDLRAMGLGDVQLRLMDTIDGMTDVEGVTDLEDGKVIISLATKIYDPNLSDKELEAKLREVMNHEIIHSLRNLGVLTDAEFKSLVKAAKEQRFVDEKGETRLFSYLQRAQAMYPQDAQGIQEEEAVAELFRDWSAGRKSIGGRPVTLFKKIINFFKSLFGALEEGNVQDPNDIFEAITFGDIGKRERRQESAIEPIGRKQSKVESEKKIPFDDTEGTRKFSKKSKLDKWLEASAVKDDVYHTTLEAFPAFLPEKTDDQAIHFSRAEEAGTDRLDELLRYQRQDDLIERRPMFPRKIVAKIQLTNPLVFPFDIGNWGDISLWKRALDEGKFMYSPSNREELAMMNRASDRILTGSEFRRVNEQLDKVIAEKNAEFEGTAGYMSDIVKPDDIWFALELMGYDGVAYTNMYEANDPAFSDGTASRESFLVWNPNQIYVSRIEPIEYGDITYYDDPRDSMTDEQIEEISTRPVMGLQGLGSPFEKPLYEQGREEVRRRLEQTRYPEKGTDPIYEPFRMFSRKATADTPAFYSATEKQIQSLLERWSYPRGTIAYAVRMPIEDFMSLTYGMGKVEKQDVVRVAKQFLEEMPSNDGSRFIPQIYRGEGEIPSENFARFDANRVDEQNYMGIPLLMLDDDGQQVVAHEGRHRTALAAIDGAETIPVQVEYKEFYTEFDYGRLRGDIPPGETFNYYDFSKKRNVISQFKDYSQPARIRDEITYRAPIPAGVPIDYQFVEDLNRVIGPQSDPLYTEGRELSRKVRAESNPFEVNLDETIVPIYPGSEGELEAAPGSIKKEDAARALYERFRQATQTEGPVAYTDENISYIARKMATEALKALEFDNNAIGWYDNKIKQAKAVLSLVHPEIFETQAKEDMFDFVLAVTSNGQAVMQNFPLAVKAWTQWNKTGQLPVSKWKEGGDRNTAMRKAFSFANQYNDLYADGKVQLSLSQFLDSDFRVKDLREAVDGLATDFGVDIKVPTNYPVNEKVKGSYVIGMKIGQGFYQNIRGNFDPLTADMWWMRMWNRMVGRPFKPRRQESLQKADRDYLRTAIKAPEGEVEALTIEDAMAMTGLRIRDINTNESLNELAEAIRSSWNRYFAEYQKRYGRNPEKPEFFKVINRYVDGLYDQLMDAPAGAMENVYMRKVVDMARGLLRDQGVDISTADFQALMWYPEKRLWKSIGVRPGQGSDVDYADAAVAMAKEKRIPDGRIEEALTNPEPRRQYSRKVTGGALRPNDRATGSTGGGTTRQLVRNIFRRAGSNESVWDVSGGSGRVSGLDVAQSHAVSPDFETQLRGLGLDLPEMFELIPSDESANVFVSAITNAVANNRFGAAVQVYSPVEYKSMRLFLSGDKNTGFALDDNNIVSVFNNPKGGLKSPTYSTMRLAVEQGGTKLDAFDTILPELYSANGFKVIARLAFDPVEAPDTWSRETFGAFNGGQPDVVFMAYDPAFKEYKGKEGEYADSYDDAVKAQDAVAARRYSRKFSGKGATAPNLYTVDQIADRLVDLTPEQNPVLNFFDREIIGRAYNEDGTPAETRWQAFTRNAVNKFLPGYVLDNFLKDSGVNINDADSVGRIMELSQNITGRTWAMTELGSLTFNKQTGLPEVSSRPDNKGLAEIFEPIGNELEQQFFAYAIAKRELELRKKGRAGFKNLSTSDANRLIAEYDQRYKQFKKVHEDYMKFNNDMIQFAIDAGTITKEEGDNFKDMAYVPYYRYAEGQDPSNLEKSISAKAKAALRDTNVFEKELKGGTIKLGGLYENITKNAELIVSSSLKNYAMQKTAEALDKAQKLGVKSWGHRAKDTETGNIITFYENGNKVRYKVEDGAMWYAVSGLTAEQKSGFVKALEAFSNLLRFGITSMPGFQLANLWRGKIDAYVRLGVDPKSFDQTFKAARDVYKNSTQDVVDFKLMTGMGGFLYGADPGDVAKSIRRGYRIKENNAPFFTQLYDRALQAKGALEQTGEASELAERMVIARKLIDEGVPKKEAMFQALNYINYGRRGAGGGRYGTGILINTFLPSQPFLNARIQGLAKIAEDPSNPGELRMGAWREMMARGLLVSAASLAFGMLAMQDDRWEEETVVEKTMNDIIYIGDYKLRIPRAFEIGAVFGMLPVMTVDAIRQKDGRDLATAVGHTFGQTFGFDLIPQAGRPVIEVMANYNFFTGRPIENIAMQRLPTELRAYESTPELYKMLSRIVPSFMDLSPLEIQTLIEGYVGSIASNTIAAGDMMAGQLGDTKDPAGTFGNPFVTSLARVTGLNRFVREDGESASRFVSDFYEIRREIAQLDSAIKDSLERGQLEEARDLMEERGAAVTFKKQFNAIARQLTEINNMMERIRYAPELSSDEKQKRILELRKRKTELSRRIVKAAKASGYFD